MNSVPLVNRLGLRVALAATLAGLAAACGGAGTGGGGAPSAEGAGLVPASTAVFISVNTDFESSQWQAAEALAARFPFGGEVVQSFLDSLTAEGVDIEADLKPALGPETDLALLELSDALQNDEEAPIVLLTQPRDREKLEELVTGGEDDAVVRDVGGGWSMVADSEAIIDRVIAGADEESLADTDTFGEAMAALEGEAVAKLYVSGPALVEGIREGAEEGAGGVDLGSLGADSLESIAVAVTAEPQGARGEGVVRMQGGPELAPYAAELASFVPADALVYASFSNLGAALEQLLDLAAEQTPDFDQQLGQLELGLGVSLEEDVLPIFEGEHALYVRAGEPQPEVTVLLSPADPAQALATLDRLTAGFGMFAALGEGEAPFTVSETTIAGVPAKHLEIQGEGGELYYALVGDRIVLTTGEAGIADQAAPSASLVDDALYREATEAAELPGETLGFVYVNLRDGLELAEQAAAGFGAADAPFDAFDAEALTNLRSLQYLVAYAAGEPDELRFAGFLGIK